MKKRIFALALALMLALSLLPMAALATDDEPVPEPTESTEEIIQEPVAETDAEPVAETDAETDAEPAAESTPEPTTQPVVLEGASGETSEATDEPIVQSVDELQVALEDGNQSPITYVSDPKTGTTDTTSDYTQVTTCTNDITEWNDGWYVVQGDVELGYTKILENANVHLILCDGATLTIDRTNYEATSYGPNRVSLTNYGIHGQNNTSLTIYGQTDGTGELIVTSKGVSVTDNAYSSAIDVPTLTVNGGKVTATAGSANSGASSYSNDAESYGIYTTALTVNGGSVTATGGSAGTVDSIAESHGIHAESDYDVGGTVTVNGGEVTATGGSATSTSDNYACAFSYGISATTVVVTGGEVTATGDTVSATGSTYNWGESFGITAASVTVTDGTQLATGSKVTATGGSATSTGYAYSYGIYATKLTVGDGEVEVEGNGGAAGSDDKPTEYAGSFGIYIYSSYVDNPDVLTVATGGKVTATAGSATSTGYAYSYGIYAGNSVCVKGTVTATGGMATGDATWYAYDIFAGDALSMEGGTVKSSRESGAVGVNTDQLTVSGGTMKLRDSVFNGLKAEENVTLAELLADGYVYWQSQFTDRVESQLSIIKLDGQTELEHDFDWYKYSGHVYYVKLCTHSTDDGECEYCGKTVTAAPDTTPAPTAAPTAKPAHSPQTGDEANLALWLALAAMSAMGIALVARKKAR